MRVTMEEVGYSKVWSWEWVAYIRERVECRVASSEGRTVVIMFFTLLYYLISASREK